MITRSRFGKKPPTYVCTCHRHFLPHKYMHQNDGAQQRPPNTPSTARHRTKFDLPYRYESMHAHVCMPIPHNALQLAERQGRKKPAGVTPPSRPYKYIRGIIPGRKALLISSPWRVQKKMPPGLSTILSPAVRVDVDDIAHPNRSVCRLSEDITCAGQVGRIGAAGET